MIEEYQYYQVLNENAELTNANTRLKLRITELEANNKNLTEKNAFLRQRPDLPVDRIPAYTAMKATIDKLEAERKELRECVFIGLEYVDCNYTIDRFEAAIKEKDCE